ncbi:MAG: ACP S-malonyltransferase [Gemmatimonadota bacterium]|nr:ACP S-malonyltransferase [Gemmatimonadota bacterium]
MSRVALLLPGQGSQFVGMGRDLAERYPEVAELYEEADELLGVRLGRLSREGPLETLTETQNAQPAILLHSYAVYRLVESRLPDVVVAAGHSLGEFTAHLIAGTFGLHDALRLVRRRGELMAASGRERPGTMAAVLGLDVETVESACRETSGGTVVPANFNAPGQIVISGDEVAVDEASERLEERGARRVLPLEVSGAFHSPLMEVARDGLRKRLEEVPMEPPRFPVVANATAEAVTGVRRARETLVEQLTSPVRWVASVERMRREEPDRWLELGPGRVLAGLVKRIDREISVESIGSAEDVERVLERD